MNLSRSLVLGVANHPITNLSNTILSPGLLSELINSV